MNSDVEDLMPRLLPVKSGDSKEVLDLKGPPRNPQEYLRQVQLEASLCPEVVVAQIDPKKLTRKQTVNANVPGCQAAPLGFSPSLRWQQQQVGNFSDVRQRITKNRKHWSSQTLDDNVQVPKLTDEEGWKRFCLGQRVCIESSSGPTDADTVLELDYLKMGFPPFLSIISRLNQSTVLAVLDILINWFEEKEFVPQLGHWLYALLACLEKPLIPEAHSSIRQLARRCAQLRSTLGTTANPIRLFDLAVFMPHTGRSYQGSNPVSPMHLPGALPTELYCQESPDDDRLAALNLLICLVARYFEQNDLADQQESTES